MGDFRELGHEPPKDLEPPVADAMTEFDVGALVIAVEDRNLLKHYGMAYSGPTVHVFSAEDHLEYLRFDLFEKAPHYHYVLPDRSNRVVVYDAGALGDMAEWTIWCLRSRVPSMLRQCQADELADRVDTARIAAAIPAITEALLANYRPVSSSLAGRRADTQVAV